MNKEDYSKYYIQGSEHYLIPKDVFDELFNEMVNWKEESKELKEKYMNLEDKYIHNVACCNEEDCDLFCEHQELKKDIKNIIRTLNKNSDDLEATEEEFESLERWNK